ncbi:MAG: hypothetical protein CIT01_01840 [Methanobacterium sp. BRmetb2]|nr:MAG: hypothetical protein CIT01_01840 [Methanobacterium sp. BRmetb2]
MLWTDKIDFLDTKQDLLVFLKLDMKNIHISDVMRACGFLLEEAKFVQPKYADKFIKSYVEGFILRVKELKDDNNKYKGSLNMGELQDSMQLLDDQEKLVIKVRSVDSHFFKIYKIISLYTTYILEEPIHIVGTPFPGGFEVKYENGDYYCPVKDKQKDNPNAVCGFCIAIQDEDII